MSAIKQPAAGESDQRSASVRRGRMQADRAKRPSTRRLHPIFDDLVLVVPALAIFGILVVAPILVEAFYSVTNWDGVNPQFSLIGLENYAQLVSDSEAREAFRTTLVIAAAASLIVNAIALPLAVLLDHEDVVTRFYRSVLFYPLVLSAIVVAFLGQGILATEGLANLLLSGVGLGPVPFLGTRAFALASVTGVAIWHTLGFTTLMYVAALKGLPDHVFEAAATDGANGWQQFRHVTLPMLAPAIAAVSILLVVYLMRNYEYVLVLTRGGPAGATQTVGFTIVLNAFTRNQYAYGSALGIVLLLAVLGMVAVALRLAQRLRYD